MTVTFGEEGGDGEAEGDDGETVEHEEDKEKGAVTVGENGALPKPHTDQDGHDDH